MAIVTKAEMIHAWTRSQRPSLVQSEIERISRLLRLKWQPRGTVHVMEVRGTPQQRGVIIGRFKRVGWAVRYVSMWSWWEFS